jgi:predicted dehydrogenase
LNLGSLLAVQVEQGGLPVATVSRTNTAEPSDRRARTGAGRSTDAPDSARIAEESAAIYPDTSPASPTPEEIAAEAYAIYTARGRADGHDLEDWLEAERTLSARRQFAVNRDTAKVD